DADVLAERIGEVLALVDFGARGNGEAPGRERVFGATGGRITAGRHITDRSATRGRTGVVGRASGASGGGDRFAVMSCRRRGFVRSAASGEREREQEIRNPALA